MVTRNIKQHHFSDPPHNTVRGSEIRRSPVDVANISYPSIQKKHTSQVVVWDFSHQQYDVFNLRSSKIPDVYGEGVKGRDGLLVSSAGPVGPGDEKS